MFLATRSDVEAPEASLLMSPVDKTNYIIDEFSQRNKTRRFATLTTGAGQCRCYSATGYWPHIQNLSTNSRRPGPGPELWILAMDYGS